MDNETATRIAKMVERYVNDGYRILSVTLEPNYDAGSSGGPHIKIVADNSAQDAGSSS